MSEQSDELVFAAEPETDQQKAADFSSARWKLLVVDDEPGVHEVTKIALKHFQFQGAGLEMVHAHSAEQARALFQQHKDIAIALIDVVMETDDAGLQLVEYVRDELKNNRVRIIMRTGQPGVAPESRVIEHYDINDYKDKTELTKQKLTTAIFSALRSYRDIMSLEQTRIGLEQVVHSTASIYSIHDMNRFVTGLLTQVMSVVGSGGDAVCAQSSGFLMGCCDQFDADADKVISASGIFAGKENMPIAEVVDETVLERIRQAVKTRENQHFDDGSVFFIHNNLGGHGIVYLSTPCLENENHRRLIELFCSNITIAYENVSLNQEIEDTQKEIIYTLGTVAEFRSKETSDHVKRVAAYVELLARKVGLSEAEVELVKMASPLHDIGKLGIADNVLHKPGKLTEAEFEIMKTHTSKGFEMLSHSKRPLLQCAAVIAQSHQEKWDGSGYPDGLSGEDIPLYGRLVAIADVFDALGSKRCYKDGWDLEEILDYFNQQRGKHFDPALVDILLNNLDEFKAIRALHTEQEEA